MPSFSRSLEKALHQALSLASERHQEYATLEHLLLALLEDQDAAAVMRACNVDLDMLRRNLVEYIDTELANLATGADEDSKPTAGFQRVIQRAVIHVQSSGREEVTGANVLVAIFAERESHAAYFLQEQDMTRYDAVNYMSHGIAKRAGMSDARPVRGVDDDAATVEDREAGKKTARVNVTPEKLRKYLGPPQAPHLDRGAGVDEVGAATGLAWTPYGGEVLEVEAQWMPGKGSLILTGQLGDVMKESAMTALSYARARAASLGLKEGFYAEREIHIHVPAGAVPKDGPSAGVTMACALVSLLTNQPVRRDVAMTGEITLRGRVLPVGGLKEKLLAAARAGIVEAIVPADNARDLEQLPQKALRGLRIVLARTMDDVLGAALKPSESRELRVES